MYRKHIKALLDRYVNDECTPEEIAMLEDWFNYVSLGNEPPKILDRAEERRLLTDLWKRLGTPGGRATAGIETGMYSRRPLIIRYVAVWAGMIIVTGGIWMQWGRKAMKTTTRTAIPNTTLTTGCQQMRRVLLPDSSVVWLNAATCLSYAPDFATHREV